MLLDLDGHIKLIDFGLSKENISLNTVTSSFCGSPEYMSPEMLVQSGHSLSVDLYSLGVVLYELLTGLPPHYSPNQQEMIDAIMNDDQGVTFPRSLSLPSKFLLSGLLTKDPDRRLGAKRGIQEVKEHPWCEDCDWPQYLQRKVRPPFVPDLRKHDWIHVCDCEDKPRAGAPVVANVNVQSTSPPTSEPSPVQLQFFPAAIHPQPQKQDGKGRLKTLYTESEMWPESTTGGSRICTLETPKTKRDSPRKCPEESKYMIEGDLDDPLPDDVDGNGDTVRQQIPISFSPLTKKSPGYHAHFHTCLTTPISKTAMNAAKLAKQSRQAKISLSPKKATSSGSKKGRASEILPTDRVVPSRFVKARLGTAVPKGRKELTVRSNK